MERALKELNFEQLLRYALSGVIALVALRFAFPKAPRLYGDASSLVVAFAGGALIYAVHRAVLHPLALHLVISACAHRIHLAAFSEHKLLHNPYRDCPHQVYLTCWEWGKDRETMEYAREPIRGWSTNIHFLYCAAWGVMSAMVAGCSLFGEPDSWLLWWRLLGLSCVCLLGAFLSDLRAVMLLFTLFAEAEKQTTHVFASQSQI